MRHFQDNVSILMTCSAIRNGGSNMIQNIIKAGDCTAVDRSVRLQDLTQWKANGEKCMPFYLHAGDCGGVLFNGEPETVRRLLRTYNAQKLFFNVELVSFLNSEGIDARRASAHVDDILGYRAELSGN